MGLKYLTNSGVFLVIILIGTVSAYYPPVSRRFFLQHQLKWPRPAAMLAGNFLTPELEAPPALKIMTGAPGGLQNMYQQDEEIKRWHVAPPGGLQGQQADWVDVEKTPVGPPGSDAAAMGKNLQYGPPGFREGTTTPPT